MSITALQEHIRKKKTPLALGLGPEANRLPAPVVKRFTDLYGESVLARGEALRLHGTPLMAQAAPPPPAVRRGGDACAGPGGRCVSARKMPRFAGLRGEVRQVR